MIKFLELTMISYFRENPSFKLQFSFFILLLKSLGLRAKALVTAGTLDNNNINKLIKIIMKIITIIMININNDVDYRHKFMNTTEK